MRMESKALLSGGSCETNSLSASTFLSVSMISEMEDEKPGEGERERERERYIAFHFPLPPSLRPPYNCC